MHVCCLQRVYFDSGDYNMSKAKIDNRSSTKPHSNKPTLIRHESTESDATATAPEAMVEHGDKENPLPEPKETASQAIPTPELLYMRRVALHMPMSAASGGDALNKRRATAAPKAALQTADGDIAAPLDAFNADAPLPPGLAKSAPRRRATLQVPSKLAMN